MWRARNQLTRSESEKTANVMRREGAAKCCRSDGSGAEPQELPGRVSVDERFVRGRPVSGSVVVGDDCLDLVPPSGGSRSLAQELDQCGWSAHGFDSSPDRVTASWGQQLPSSAADKGASGTLSARCSCTASRIDGRRKSCRLTIQSQVTNVFRFGLQRRPTVKPTARWERGRRHSGPRQRRGRCRRRCGSRRWVFLGTGRSTA